MRYLRLLRTFTTASLRSELEYRSNAIASVLMSLFWLGWALGSVSIIYGYEDEIAGWSYQETLVVVGLFYAMNGYRQAFITPNVSRIGELVRTGSLDFLLLKPVSSQFMVTFRQVSVYNLADPVIGVAVALALAGGGGHLTASRLPAFAVLLGFGFLALHSLALLLHSATVWITSSTGADNLLKGSLEVARIPLDFYPGPLRIVLMTVLPVGLATTVPARALVGRVGWLDGLATVGLVVLLFVLASHVWRRALESYTSAGG
ncbi:MAG TPA: ABC-2 family transporter protein [Micromonosporaceae bacterium]|nr:ABC-2 family transporter protein [Micromonosporaceae bacterium]